MVIQDSVAGCLPAIIYWNYATYKMPCFGKRSSRNTIQELLRQPAKSPRHHHASDVIKQKLAMRLAAITTG
jgi:hypothetical protein